MPLVRGVAGVIVSTSHDRFEAMAHFYEMILGAHRRSRRTGFVNFEWGETRLTVTLHDAVEGRTDDPARIMINLECSDLDLLAAELADRGVPIVRPPESESWGGRICTIEDPDGNYLQFMEIP